MSMSSIFKQFFNLGKDDRQPAKIEYANEKNPEMDPVKITAQIYGRVQGVGFRFTTVQLAKDLHVNGFVRNENDGSVYVEAVADAKQMEEFIIELAKGPSPSADVDKVVIKYDDSLPNYEGFTNQY